MKLEIEERIRKSFSKVKEDIYLLKESIETISQEVKTLKETLDNLDLKPFVDESDKLREPLREVTTRSTPRSE